MWVAAMRETTIVDAAVGQRGRQEHSRMLLLGSNIIKGVLHSVLIL